MITSPVSFMLTALAFTSLSLPAAAQTYSTCNPLTESGCSADTALGKSVTIDFTSGASSQFSVSGSPTYGDNGAEFTVAKSGDAPTISSKWYIMFGHVDFVIQAAPGTGIVSAAVLQSDDLDEIDWEWIGGDDSHAQSNYFGKGITTEYNRGGTHSAPNNHDGFHTYSVDWTAEEIVWSIDGTTVRAMTQAEADSGQYPQTPMYVKIGVWAGGDPSNSAGTISWAGGETDYSAGPFTMYLKSVSVKDYSTGSSYSYSGTSGTWESIVSDGGKVNSAGNSTSESTSTASASATTSTASSSAPLAFSNSGSESSSSASHTGWPWVTTSGTATASASSTGVTVSPSNSTSYSAVSASASVSGSSPEQTSTSQNATITQNSTTSSGNQPSSTPATTNSTGSTVSSLPTTASNSSTTNTTVTRGPLSGSSTSAGTAGTTTTTKAPTTTNSAIATSASGSSTSSLSATSTTATASVATTPAAVNAANGYSPLNVWGILVCLVATLYFV
ncbi:transglycosylase [Exophiala sideris]|uniref:Crh-like protein n=1 Tax=Exophiala sideris TaxID=1016849 RepID=A0ABR0JQA6_9EURO|nr:transglycosylase [Exophiala sideris]KAK5041325.1 transglycosylase [Exophiala sideris]KAK5068152.1 transglycosylase [Exophiala sideris]KAK5187453.1 transglycosylase [Eurotiomycetes sp. CCFEE 6388]